MTPEPTPKLKLQQRTDLELETVLEFTLDAITALDREWHYTYVNHSAELLLRRKREELVSCSIWEAFPDLLDTPAEAQLRRSAEESVAVKFEMFLPKLYAWHEVRAVPTQQDCYYSAATFLIAFAPCEMKPFELKFATFWGMHRLQSALCAGKSIELKCTTPCISS
jgi:PAS domain-containing protein